jgi:hypothetical protein
MRDDEWYTVTYSDSFTGPSSEEPVRPRPYRRWLPVAAALLALVLVGATVLYRQRTMGQAALAEDLAAFIFEEEAIRAFQDPEQATALMAAGAPPAWQEDYQASFAAGVAPPASVRVESVEFDGRCALVDANLDGHRQARAYCLNGRQWRRAPVPETAWGETETTSLAGGPQLSFRARDRAFAETLVDDLPPLFEALDRLAAPPAGRVTRQTLDIAIEPYELHGPLIVGDLPRRIVLNSPLLVPFDGQAAPDGSLAVRLALAKALVRRTGDLSPEELPAALPGAGRFVAAVQTVLAGHLILSPAEMERLVDAWRGGLAEPWLSPFYADLLQAPEPPDTRQAELAAYLTAEYIYRLEGAETLAALLRELPAAGSWDALFQADLGRSTVGLESEVNTYVRKGAVSIRAIPESDPVPAGSGLSLQVTFLGAKDRPDGNQLIQVALPGQAEPVLVELPSGLQLRAGGADLPPACAFPGSKLQVKGKWLEVQRRLQASQVTVQEPAPLAIEPAPADTIAYLVQGETPIEGGPALEHVFLSTHFYLIATSQLPVPQALVALRENGTVQPLTPLSSTLRVRPLPVAAGDPIHFLFIADRPGCEFSWFVHYDTRQGVTGQWFVPAETTRWVWRADRQDLMFFIYSMARDVYDMYEGRAGMSLRLVGNSTMPALFTGWNMNTENLVFVRTWMGTMGIGLLEPDTGSMSRLKVYVQPLRARQLSPNGTWLAYLTGVKNLFDPPYRLDVLNIESRQERTLIRSEQGKRLGPPNWSLYLDDPRLAVLAGPLVEKDRLRPTHLLVVSPERDEDYVTVAEAVPGEQLATPVFCADGDMLYRVDTGNEYRLDRYQPGQETQTLLTSDLPFLPVACP